MARWCDGVVSCWGPSPVGWRVGVVVVCVHVCVLCLGQMPPAVWCCGGLVCWWFGDWRVGCWRCVPDGAPPLAGWCVGGSTVCSHVGVFAWGLLPPARGCVGGLVYWWFGDWSVGVLVLFS